MGHDITAYRSDVDRDALRIEYGLIDEDGDDSGEEVDEWLARYEEYDKHASVAHLRRSAGDPMNQVIYLALGVLDEAYAGPSGKGVELPISLDQLRTAETVLLNKTYQGVKLDPKASRIMNILQRMLGGSEVVVGVGEQNPEQELEFVRACIAHLEEVEGGALFILFS
ncbi:hypothetical protein KOR34_04670 [Posidoniimonas corsicana]|uniref:Uncharacterized protein n=1 Tax=Posidoniimonas corsicana TaxID=1938618 RepID=A0A5C5VAF3_9BACT|nr:hypothetical protein [Posidoniimonas corsicana]TWT35574.1 hypothetical protein KOR34_04670 [Posidoniimonas corsicana]